MPFSQWAPTTTSPVFKAIAESADIPIIIYNIPGRTGVNMEPDTLLRLAEVPNIVGVKEASGNLDQMMLILRDRPKHFAVLSGDDSLSLPLISVGGDGSFPDRDQ